MTELNRGDLDCILPDLTTFNFENDVLEKLSPPKEGTLSNEAIHVGLFLRKKIVTASSRNDQDVGDVRVFENLLEIMKKKYETDFNISREEFNSQLDRGRLSDTVNTLKRRLRSVFFKIWVQG